MLNEKEFEPRDVRNEEDIASDAEEEMRSDEVGRISRNAAKIEAGAPGYCDLCGFHFERVVKRQYRNESVYACGRCRDENKLG